MDKKRRNQLVFHGAIVMLLGLLAGFPFAMVITGGMEGEVRAWRMAHMEGVLNSVLMFAVAGVGGSLALDQRKQSILTWAMLVTGYGNIIASIVGASTGNRGLQATGPAANWVVFVLFMAGVVAILIAVALIAYGARPGGSPDTAKVTVEVSDNPAARQSTPARPASAATAVTTSVSVDVAGDAGSDDDDDDDNDDAPPRSRAERRRKKGRRR